MENKIYSGIVGLVVADAVGVPMEFRERDTFEVTGMSGYGAYNQPPGTWSDDSSMTLATVESISRLGRVDPDDIMKNFTLWFNRAKFTPHGEVFDIGGATLRAINRYKNGAPIDCCGGGSEADNGNGSLMRILPLTFVKCTDRQVADVSAITHAHRVSTEACVVYVNIARSLIDGSTIEKAVAEAACNLNSPEYNRLRELGTLPRSEIRSSGYVVDTLEAALWCLLKSSSYRECVLLAVNLGGDTDTVAAVAGGLAGIVYGCGRENGIPDDWISQVARRKWIKRLCKKFEKRAAKIM